MQSTDRVQKMLKFRERLPAWERKEELLAAIARNQVMVSFLD
jgi:HrpA-like RNA helicase